MRKMLTVVLTFCLAMSVFAGDKRIQKVKRVPAVVGDEQLAAPVKVSSKHTTSAAKVGPGVVLSETTYDFSTNTALGRHIHNYGGGVMAVVRTLSMGAIGTWPDRGTFYIYNDGASGFLLPMSKVEAGRRGWGNISVMSDGREVTAAHGGLEVNVDAIQGFGIWTSSLTGVFPAGSDPTWPRVAVDGADNIHIAVTHFAFNQFPSLGGQYTVYARSTDQGLNWRFRYLFQPAGSAPDAPPDTSTGLWQGGGDADAYAIDAWQNKVGIVSFASYDGGFNSNEILFAESLDNGVTWTFTNISQVGNNAPPPDGDFRPNGHVTFAYDVEGQPHAIWGTFLVLPDTAGAPSSFSFTLSPLQHWSPSTGVTYVASRSDIPDGENTGFPGSENWARGLGSGVYWPSLGVGAGNKLYVTFNAPTPNDFDADTLNYLDVYATGSADGGSTWGSPVVNITNSTGTEDKYASLAKLVDDSLRVVYFSDEVNGGIVQPGNQTTNATFLYLSFPTIQVPTTTAVAERPTNVPDGYALAQNYPNPFNPSTEISFSLPTAEKVSLRIFNLSGQEVVTLVNGKLKAGGHKMKWNAEGMPSGVYFYRLEAGSFSEVKKMILLQ